MYTREQLYAMMDNETCESITKDGRHGCTRPVNHDDVHFEFLNDWGPIPFWFDDWDKYEVTRKA